MTASEDKTARIWNATTGQAIVTLTGHTDAVFAASFSPEDARVVTASEDKTARIWNAATGQPIATLTGHTDAGLCRLLQPGRHPGGDGVQGQDGADLERRHRPTDRHS